MLERAINCVLITHGSSTYPTWETSCLDSSGEGRVKKMYASGSRVACGLAWD